MNHSLKCREWTFGFHRKTIRLGEFDVRKETDCNTEYGLCSKADDYNIERITGHKNYSTSTKQNDISLIRVDRDITFNSCKHFWSCTQFQFPKIPGTTCYSTTGFPMILFTFYRFHQTGLSSILQGIRYWEFSTTTTKWTDSKAQSSCCRMG